MKDDKEYIFANIFEIASRSMANPLDKTDMTSCLDTLNSLMEEQKDADVSIDVNCISNILKPKVANGLIDLQSKMKAGKENTFVERNPLQQNF